MKTLKEAIEQTAEMTFNERVMHITVVINDAIDELRAGLRAQGTDDADLMREMEEWYDWMMTSLQDNTSAE